MYKKKNDVQNLIDALTNGEKRHFYNYFKPDNSKENAPNFWKLFETLRSNKSRTPNTYLSARSFVAAKRLLYDNILRSLRTLHDESSVDIIIQNNLSNVELLYDHNLADQAILLIEKTLLVARKNEKFGLLLQTLEWEKRINIVSTKPLRTLEYVRAEEQEVIQKMLQMKGLETLHTQIMNLKRQFGYARGEIKDLLDSEIIHSELMPHAENCLSSKAIYYRNLIMAIYCWMTFDHDRAYTYSQALVTFDGSKIIPNDFMSGLLQHITSTVCIADFEGTLKTIELSNAFIRQSRLEHSLPFKYLMLTYNSIYQLIVFTYTGDTRRLKKVIKESQQILDNKELNLPVTNRQIILGNMMNGYICLGDHEAATRVWELQFDKQFKNVRLDIYGDLYLSRLFIMLQQKDLILLESAVSSAYKFFNKHNKESRQFELELAITNVFKRNLTANWERASVHRNVVTDIKHNIVSYIRSLHPDMHFQEHYSRYVIWCDALIKNTSFSTAAKEWYEKMSRT